MNTVDIIVIAVVAFSALIAFLRGFVREMLTIGSWIGAALVTLYAFPVVQSHFEQWITNRLAAHVVGIAVLFIGSLIVFSILSNFVARFVRGSALTAVDRSLGLLYGLLRGAVLVSLAYMIVMALEPSLFAGARTVPMMAKGAEILRSLAPKELSDEITTQLPLPASQAEDNQKQDAVARPAYTQRQNDALQRLMDAASGK